MNKASTDMNDIRSKHDIKVFVDDFYFRVRKDQTLGPVFIAALGDSEWTTHLEKMYSFWNTILFGQKDYSGNPFAKHSPLPLQKCHFDRWLTLFKETIENNFEGSKAQDALMRADRIAQIFQAKMGVN